MNSLDMSLEDGPSIVTKAFPGISLVVPGHFYWFSWIYVCIGLGSVRDCKDRSKRSISKGLFHNI